MRRFFFIFFPSLLVSSIFFQITPIHAQDISLFANDIIEGFEGNLTAGCVENGDCTICDFIVFGVRATRWILGIAGAVALLLLVIAGLFLILSAGNSNIVEKAKNILKGTIFGLFFVLFSWQIINIILVLFVVKDTEPQKSVLVRLWGNPWNTIACTEYSTFQPVNLVQQSIEAGPLSTTGATGTTTLSLTNIGNGGINRKQYEGISASLETKLKALDLLVPAGSAKIESLSDDNIFFNQCYRQNGVCASACQHGGGDCNSGHYGPKNVNFDSTHPPATCAVDLSANGFMTYTALEDLARQSGFIFVQCEKNKQRVDCSSTGSNTPDHLHADLRCHL